MKSPRSGPSYRMVFFSSGIQRHFQRVRSPSGRSVCDKGECDDSHLHVSHPSPHGMEGGHFSAPIGLLKCLFLPPSALLRRVLLRLMLSWNLSIVPVASLVLRSAGSSGGRTLQTPYAVKPASSDPYKKISRKSRVTVPACVKVIKQLIRNASFSKEVVWDVASDLRKSTACFYRGQLFRFLHWCRGLNTAPLKATVWWIAMFFLYMLRVEDVGTCNEGL